MGIVSQMGVESPPYKVTRDAFVEHSSTTGRWLGHRFAAACPIPQMPTGAQAQPHCQHPPPRAILPRKKPGGPSVPKEADEAIRYIVTGAGSAGCVLAARLSESGRYKVLLLEAGGKDNKFWIHVPMGYAKTFVDPKVNWKFESEPEQELNGRTMYQPRGKVLGGTSSINGMIYMRGNAADYDQWRQLGNEGWDYESVLPYFRKAEDNERGENQFHGVGGPLRVSNQPYDWEIARSLL